VGRPIMGVAMHPNTVDGYVTSNMRLVIAIKRKATGPWLAIFIYRFASKFSASRSHRATTASSLFHK